MSQERPRPPILKRFANLDIDGVEVVREKPARASAPPGKTAAPSPPTVVTRPAPTPPRAAMPAEIPSALRRPAPLNRSTRDPDMAGLEGLERLGNELNDNARFMRQGATPEAQRAQRAAELRAARPMDPRAPRPPTEPRARPEERFRFDTRRVSAESLDLDLPDGMGGGVVSVEIDLSRGRSRALDLRFESRPMPGPTPARTPPARGDGPPWDLPREAPPRWAPEPPRPRPGVNAFTERTGPRALPAPETIELTPLAARQIQLMAWEAGVPGSPLRILTSNTPGLGHPEIDFAFDDDITPEDTVVDALGVTVVIDPESLVWVRGRRITWLDVPGSEGFLLR
jgi:Fe-S cluster assembly iron-binding protein IscA